MSDEGLLPRSQLSPSSVFMPWKVQGIPVLSLNRVTIHKVSSLITYHLSVNLL